MPFPCSTRQEDSLEVSQLAHKGMVLDGSVTQKCSANRKEVLENLEASQLAHSWLGSEF